MALRRLTVGSWMITALLMLMIGGGYCFGDVTLPSIFGNDMVLQRDRTVVLWGWAEPGEAVTISLQDIEVSTEADDSGDWEARLPGQEAGGPYHLVIAGNNRIEYNNVLFGEVWFASGQSNMEWQVKNTDGAAEAIAGANYPQIRLFNVPRKTSGEPLKDCRGSWQVCSPQTVDTFSAVAFYYGEQLHHALKVPVGLIASSWGGTRIEPWTPKVGFEQVSRLSGVVGHIESAESEYRRALYGDLAALEEWISQTRQAIDEGAVIDVMPGMPNHKLDSNRQPTGLYNAMVHPIVAYTLRGFIWYQGEANLGDGALYTDKMEALIEGWRSVWDDDDLPFYFAQLAPYDYRGDPSRLPILWEAQAAVLTQVRHTGMAIINDIGNVKDIHPRNKKDVGKRLALWSLANTYGQELVYSGPMFRKMTVDGNRVRVHFDYVGSGLAIREGDALQHFEIGDAAGNYKPAQAVIEDDTVVVWNDEIVVPSAVRYLWGQTKEGSLMNKEGLPAGAFSATD